MGKVRLAQCLARAGLHLAATTVARMRTAAPTNPTPGSTPSPRAKPRTGRTITARYPHHVWNVDLTLLPLVSGFWVPWLPQTLLLRWPFAFWLFVVLDHHSRAVVDFKVLLSQPATDDLTRVLDAARRKAGVTPKYIVSDRGAQFRDDYVEWCRRRSIRPRFGAVGKSGSIAVIERFFRSLKDEMLRRLPVLPMPLAHMMREIDAYVRWYNEHRPHQGLDGDTPAERRDRAPAARKKRARETRSHYPLARGDPAPSKCKAKRRRLKGQFVLQLDCVAHRDHLPIVELKHAA